jgi:hypothetical protein
MHSIEYDPIHDEIAVPIPFAGAILTFRAGANGEEPPLRIIQGPLTQITDPSRLGLDPVNNEILVPSGGRILVFNREANGNVAPIRVLEGVSGGSVAVDPIHDLLITVGGTGAALRTQIQIFDRKAAGGAKPKGVITGPRTMLTNTGGPSTVYPPKGRILVPIRGPVNNQAMFALDSFVGVWNVTDNGDVPPQWIIGGPRGVFQMVRGVAVNEKHKEVIVTDKRLNAVLTFYMPEMF